MINGGDAGHPAQGSSEGDAVVAVPAHTQVQGPEAAQREPGIEWPQSAPGSHRPCPRGRHQVLAPDHNAREQVGVAAHVFRRAVHDGGGSYPEGAEKDWGRESVVDQQGHASSARQRGYRFDIRQLAEGIGDRLHEREAGAVERASDHLEVRHVDEVGLIAGGLEVLAQERKCAAIQLASSHNRDRPRRESEDRHVQRCHPTRSGHARLPALQLGDRLLEHRPVEVGVAAVVMPRPVPTRNRLVVVQVGVNVDRRRTEVGRERAPGDQFAAGVNRPRCRFHGKLEPCA